jgi:hypothetical protein
VNPFDTMFGVIFIKLYRPEGPNKLTRAPIKLCNTWEEAITTATKIALKEIKQSDSDDIVYRGEIDSGLLYSDVQPKS